MLARLISAAYNYSINYFFVFKSRKNQMVSVSRYVLLAVAIMLTSGLLTSAMVSLFHVYPELWVKIPVDILLFIVSYIIQKRYVF